MYVSHRRGAACEYTAAAYFSSKGWTIFWTPSGATPCDFLIRKDGETQAIQVKSAALRQQGQTRYLRACIQSKRPYVSSDFDLLVIVGPAGRIWAIPFEKLPNTATLYLEKIKDGETETYGWEQWLIVI